MSTDQETELLRSIGDLAFQFRLVMVLERLKEALVEISRLDDAHASKAVRIAQAALGEKADREP